MLGTLLNWHWHTTHEQAPVTLTLTRHEWTRGTQTNKDTETQRNTEATLVRSDASPYSATTHTHATLPACRTLALVCFVGLVIKTHYVQVRQKLIPPSITNKQTRVQLFFFFLVGHRHSKYLWGREALYTLHSSYFAHFATTTTTTKATTTTTKTQKQ